MLLKIEAPYEKEYWLYADISMTSTLQTLDNFLGIYGWNAAVI